MRENKYTPQHIAVIMDGNGRWALRRGLPRAMGHKAGAKAVERILEASLSVGIKYLTLYAFSWENWSRPKREIDTLMKYLKEYLDKAAAKFNKKGVRLLAIGELYRLPQDILKALNQTIKSTEHNKTLTLILALSYGGRQEIVNAVKTIAEGVKNNKISLDSIDEEFFSENLYTAHIPDPDILIRTSHELRLSNFQLWQLSYSEFYFSKKLWPDFNKKDLVKIIADFSKRERRYGNV